MSQSRLSSHQPRRRSSTRASSAGWEFSFISRAARLGAPTHNQNTNTGKCAALLSVGFYAIGLE